MSRYRYILGMTLLLLVASCRSEPEPMEPGATRVETARVDERPVILFLGDSLTAGYHLDPEDAFPALIQRRIDAELDGDWRAVNAGVSGDTTADGLNRLNWVLRQPVDVLVLALGANDALRGQPIDNIRRNLDQILERTRERYPEVRFVIAGMQMPHNYGAQYTAAFRALFVELAEKYDAALVPFLLEGVAGDPSLNLRDGIHPTEVGHEIIADTVWTYLKPLL